MHRLTASRLDLAATCPASPHLGWQKDTSEAAQTGTFIHAFLERAIAGDEAGALEVLPPDLRGRMSSVDLAALRALFPSPAIQAELAFGYDPTRDDARVLPRKGPRDYSQALPGEIVGTVDAVCLHDDVLVCLDWKTGANYVPHPRENLQVKFAVLAAARAYSCGGVMPGSVVGAVVKIDEDGAAKVFAATFDDMDLDGIAGELYEVQQRVENATPADTVLGPMCRWCPARRSCPAQADAAQQLVALAARGKAVLAPEEKGRAYLLAKAVEGAAEDVLGWIRADLEDGGTVTLPDGKVVRLVESKRESVIVEAAILAASELGLDNIGSVLAAATLSKDNIREHLKGDADRLIEAVKQADGMRRQTITQMRVCNAATSTQPKKRIARQPDEATR